MNVAIDKTMKLSSGDNVMVAISELGPHSIIAKTDLRSQDKIPAGLWMAKPVSRKWVKPYFV
jgi:hypothetical protein